MNNKCIATGVQLQKYFGSSEVQLEVIEYIVTSLFITCPLISSCQNYVISHLSLGTQCNPLTYYGYSTHQGETNSKKAFLSSCNGALISESIFNLVPSNNCPSISHFRKEVVFKLRSKYHFNKKCAPKFLSFNKKKSERFE